MKDECAVPAYQAFGCARVVFNDALRARKDAHEQGRPYPKTGDLSKQLITEAKKTPERAWLGEVSSVVLQQSLRDLDTAYKNFFGGLKGKRPRTGAPRFKSKRDTRQSIRFTVNARRKITTGGDLSLPKVGDVRVKWSRALPSTPSTVTVVKDSAGRYFASFVVTEPTEVLPQTEAEVGIDLGLGHFAVLSDGTKVDSPRFLRRVEKRLKKAQRELSRKQKGSSNRGKARVKVARAHARVADARREFRHQRKTASTGHGRCGGLHACLATRPSSSASSAGRVKNGECPPGRECTINGLSGVRRSDSAIMRSCVAGGSTASSVSRM
ncbi:transposase [Streptomyces misionensis]|uniref:RNA-guided endonuclease InsQ/TnpB family protein n=1 Tax=Streptomyces misionensis TaxID=67331 RepID=UPI0033E12325